MGKTWASWLYPGPAGVPGILNAAWPAAGGENKLSCQALTYRTVLRPVALESVAMADCRIVVKPYRLTLGPSRTVTLPGGESSHDHERGPV
jgi:hypothetical protein